MSDQWYYAKNKQRSGPVSLDQLKTLAASGQLLESDPVWCKGMAAWAPANTVPDLFADAPPPLPPSSVPQQTNQPNAADPIQNGVTAIKGFFAGLNTQSQAATQPTRLPIDRNTLSCPWSEHERDQTNPKLYWAKIGMIASIIVGTIFLISIVGAVFCLPFYSLAALIWIFAISPGRLHGRWNSVDKPNEWIEFLSGGEFKQAGIVGTFTLLPNQIFIDLLSSGRILDSWKILAWNGNILEVQLSNGSLRSFKKGKTLAEKQIGQLLTNRTLVGSWEPINAKVPSLLLFADGGFLRSDGFGAKWESDADDRAISITPIGGGTPVSLPIVALTSEELVISVEGQSLHYKRGTTVTGERLAEIRAKQVEFAKNVALVAVSAVAIVGIGTVGVIAAAGAAGAASGAGGGNYGGSGPVGGDRSRSSSPPSKTGTPASTSTALPPPSRPKGNAVALCGAVVLSYDGSRVEFQKKCEHCGSLQAGTTRAPFGGGRGSVTSGSFPCMKCKRMNEYKIAGS
jgi:hypothetical protein